MPLLFTRRTGSSQPEKTLYITEYVERLDAGILTPTTASFRFKTYFKGHPPLFVSEEHQIKRFRDLWTLAIGQLAEKFNLPADRVRELIRSIPAQQKQSVFPEGQSPAIASAFHSFPVQSALLPTILEEVDCSPGTQQCKMEKKSSDTLKDAASAAADRQAIRMKMFKHMRPESFPLSYHWVMWHDRLIPNMGKSTSSAPTYHDRLSNLAQISDIRKFWEVVNNLPLTNLPLRDTVHLFKLGTEPVWEDPRNARGGCWTFRIPKAHGPEFFIQILTMAIGDLFEVEPGDDICGISMSVRFTSNLIMIWNRDSSNQKSIDGILALVLREIPEHLRPKEGGCYYKKHSEHNSFNKELAESKEAAKRLAMPNVP
ncbi:translation initiation factor eIF4e [Xylona heveae TC161]|uniref:Translation initiation factor eIF4e n=1 Tax=Xylona heveae (strain CBS 132557 / TC161) TaxID=1328760 RepID=A0A165JTZ7_XYLHT|nr:translation initiation factor eIF4e [Xylona heveae TC161]KZF26626.1 translation initiation factor eIF4e [Xylona heveae TC161]